jgi:hypothetical protein
MAVVALIEPPPGHDSVHRDTSLERRLASLHLDTYEAADVYALVVSSHDPVVSAEIVLGVWCYSPAEALELRLDGGLSGRADGVVRRGPHGSARLISPMRVG